MMADQERWEVDDWEDEDFFDHGYGLVDELSYDYLVLLSSVVPPQPPPNLDCDTTDTLLRSDDPRGNSSP